MPRRILTWGSKRVGNRGVCAFILGFIWFFIGVATLIEEPVRRQPISIVSPWVRVLLWMPPALYAMGWQFVKSARTKDDHNVWGLLIVGPASQFLSSLAGLILEGLYNLHVLHDPQFNYDLSWLGLLFWLAMMALVDRCGVGMDRLPLPPLPRPGGPDG